MTVKARRRQAVTSTVLFGCLVAALGTPPAAAEPAAARPTAPYQVEQGTVFRAKPPTAVLPVAGYRLTGRFGDVSPYWSSAHTGLDFAAAYGSPIRSISRGVVVDTAYDGAFGNKTVVRLADGTEVWYCHQSEQVAQVGDRIRPGGLIGYLGTTGNTTGPHLHLEWHAHGGDPVDPFRALVALGVRP